MGKMSERFSEFDKEIVDDKTKSLLRGIALSSNSEKDLTMLDLIYDLCEKCQSYKIKADESQRRHDFPMEIAAALKKRRALSDIGSGGIVYMDYISNELKAEEKQYGHWIWRKKGELTSGIGDVAAGTELAVRKTLMEFGWIIFVNTHSKIGLMIPFGCPVRPELSEKIVEDMNELVKKANGVPRDEDVSKIMPKEIFKPTEFYRRQSDPPKNESAILR